MSMVMSVSFDGLEDLIAKLNGLSKTETKKIIKAAVNDTAKEARKLIANQTYKIYQTKKKGITSTLSVKKASVSKPESAVVSRGTIRDPLEYKATPTTMAAQQKRKIAAKAKILRSGKLKRLEVDGRKAFVTEFKWNPILNRMNATPHVAVAQRTGDDPNNPRKIKTLYSPAIPIAIGSERTLSIIQPLIRQSLADNLSKHIEEVMSTK